MQTPISDLSKLTKTQLIALLQAQRVWQHLENF
jgi:hypothetical protein